MSTDIVGDAVLAFKAWMEADARSVAEIKVHLLDITEDLPKGLVNGADPGKWLLYSGGSAINQLAVNTAAKAPTEIGIIDNTFAGRFVLSTYVQGVLETRLAGQENWIYRSSDGLWPNMSARYVDTIHGDVVALMNNAPPDGILATTELTSAIERGQIERINGIDREDLRDRYHAGGETEKARLELLRTVQYESDKILADARADPAHAASKTLGAIEHVVGETFSAVTPGTPDAATGDIGKSMVEKVIDRMKDLKANGGGDAGSVSLELLGVADAAHAVRTLGRAAGAFAIVTDILATTSAAAKHIQAGDSDAALNEIGEFAARNVGATIGGIAGEVLVGAALGIALAALEITPVGWVLTAAAFVGIGIGALIGSQVGESLYKGFGDFMNDLFSGDIADWLNPSGPLYYRPPIDPLVLDLNGDGLDVVALADSTAHFDLNNNGLAEKTAWIGPDDGFLAIDKNANGMIDGISELFGSETEDGFASLSVYDANHDGQIDQRDAAYSKLVVWRDLDQDGVTDGGELQSLQQAGIVKIDLHREVSNVEINGNLTTETSSFVRADGTTGQVSDIWFQNDQVHTVDASSESTPISDGVALLPHLTGFGTVRDLSRAADSSIDLKLALETLVTSSAIASVQQTYEGIEALLLKWAGADNAVPDSRGDIDARHVAFLEAVHGVTYLNLPVGSPVVGNAAVALEGYYQQVIHSFAEKLAAQLPTSAASVLKDASIIDSHPLALLGGSLYDKMLSGSGAASAIFEHVLGQILSNIPVVTHSPQDLAPVLHVIEELQTFLPDRTIADVTAAVWVVGEVVSNHALDSDSAMLLAAVRDGARLVSGTGGADALNGHGTFDELFIGGAGDDTLTGGDGNDVYIWRPGDGDDTVLETGQSWSDVLQIDGVPASDVRLQRIGADGDILVSIAETPAHAGGSVLLPQGTGIEFLKLAGATMLLADAFRVLGTDLVLTNEADSWGGGDYADTIDGADGDDSLWGGAGEDHLLGGAGNDYLLGQDGNDDVSGGGGDDYLYGDAGDDILTGGAGSDTLDGGEGNDTFVWSRGDGNDFITDAVGAWYAATPAGVDVLRLHGVQPGQVRLVTYSNDTNSVVVHVEESTPGAGDGESLTLTNSRTEWAVDGGYAGIELIQFDDGTVWDRGTIEQAWFYVTGSDSSISGTVRDDHIVGGSGEDSLSGWDGDDTISGGAGNDYISGDDGNDTLIGGTGDDTLTGGAGDDTFVWSRGDGNDTISDYTGYDWAPSPTGTDVLVLHGVTPSQVSLAAFSTDLNAIVLTIAESAPGVGDGDTLTLRGSRADDGQGAPFAGVDSVIFDDGTVWDRSVLEAGPVIGTASDDNISGSVRADDISAGAGNDSISGYEGDDTIRGGAGDDTIFGQDGSDVLIGGEGSDYLDGGTGNDTFVWARGDGSDTIYDQDGPEWAAVATGVDILRLDGVLPSQVTLAAYSTNMNAVVLTISESAPGRNDGGTLTLMGSRYDEGTGGPYVGIDSVVFADGTVWDRTVIEAAPIFGTTGADTIVGSIRDDRVSAGAGDDYVIGEAGADVLDGGAGNDVLTGGDGDDALTGGTGDDTLYGDAGADTITGGAGTDWMDGGEGDDTFVWSRGDGTDAIADQSIASSGVTPLSYDVLRLHGVLPSQVALAAYSTDMNAVSLLIAESSPGAKDGGTITLSGGRYDEGPGGPYVGLDAVIFDDGTMWDRAKLESAPISGTTGSDSIFGSVRDDVISAGAGDDYVYGDAGADTIDGGTGNDSLIGGDGNDSITGGTGNDSVWGDAGDDTLTGGVGTDWIEGGDGDDTFVWARGDGSDTVSDSLGSSSQPVPAGFDVLRLLGVTPSQVTLTTSSADHFTVILTIAESVSGKKDGGVLTLQSSRYHETTGPSAGIDSIVFADGTTWDHSVIEHAVLNGTSSADSISGTIFEDVIAAGSGNDAVYADAGNDSIDGGAGNDTVYAGEGNDVLIGGTGNDSLYGEAGDDTITGGVGTDILDGGDGDDTFIWARGDGSDTISDNNGSTASPIPAGTDVLRLTGILPSQVTLSTSSNDLNSVILTIAPSVSGAADGGVLTLLASRYDDGTPGSYAGVDRVVFSDGTVWDHATFLRAPIIGTSAADTIYGTVRDDSIDGGAGNDTIYGDAGHDTLIGNTGNDILYGDAGNDTLTGGAGTDTLYGGDGNDTLNGGDSNDSLTGGAGNDVLTGGGTSVDTFIFNFGDTGVDRVTDFGAVAGTNHDYLRLIGFNTNFSTVVAGAVEDSVGTHLHITPDLEILLEGVHKSDLSTDDFKWS